MKKKIDYNPRELAAAFDAAFANAWNAATYLGGLKDRDYYVCLDGSSRPFYGKAKHYSKRRPERRLAEMTIAGQWATAAFRQKGAKRGVTMYRGTVNKHDFFVMSGHLYNGQESFPLGIRRGRITHKSIEEFTGILDRLPIKPAFIFADKEFPFLTKLQKLRPWCDANGVGMLIAHPKNAAVMKLIAHAWHSGQAHRIPGAPEPVYWSVQEHNWRQARTKMYNLLTLYFHDDPRQDPTADEDDVIKLPDGIYTISFYANVEVTAENAYWLWKQYAYRWNCENLFARWLAYCGQSHGHGMFLRDFFFNASMLMLAGYALWRLERARRLRLPAPSKTRKLNADLSHSRYFGALQWHLSVGLAANHLAKSRLPAPPMPATLLPPRLPAPPAP